MRSLLIVALLAAIAHAQDAMQKWKPNDPARPWPRVVTPGTSSTQGRAGQPPSDAIVLFNGWSLKEWESLKGGKAPWIVRNGVIEIVPHTGDIHTKRKFGNCQLHVEWAAPITPTGSDQKRGNSGVWLMSNYEVQVLDSYKNDTYPDGQAGAMYVQYPPLVNASRPPGKWQSYDIVFHRPRFDKTGRVLTKATITVFHNGVLIQDNVVLTGPSAFHARPPYSQHPDSMPLMLQDHNNKVRYRNIWIRKLE
ncbi:MAG: hypothetical protein QOJ65_2049 [Fimbriimonadaceae bacterium]|nr:hypothetical protein [Fimbriimonadaceae bacterium]